MTHKPAPVSVHTHRGGRVEARAGLQEADQGETASR
jgi:hypothetical protein